MGRVLENEGQVLQSSDDLGGPPLDPLQSNCVFPELQSPGLNTNVAWPPVDSWVMLSHEQDLTLVFVQPHSVLAIPLFQPIQVSL
ncbi:hypothetical protein WISP_143349 [Willisornis vidua]|uniref:Uncharacterized protein n=1 Tax=Willisornis vidua TaxID=1566151 RepID=A0ABQ9CP29_9PASS|nr:hypothetical protein WISP_143349 [Willisornis vidua]